MKRTKEEFDTFWATTGLGQTVSEVIAPTQTLRPKTILREGDLGSLPKLPQLIGRELRDTMPELEIREVLGEGGMGLVRLARQVPMGRDVAVKTLRDSVRSRDEALLALLREGWVTGVLEHPNIIPIYQLGRDKEGDPMIVMKRIEGVSWWELIRHPEQSPRNFDSDDPLDWHLQILMSVCNAVHFAHSKGIIHRDLKPDNVMIGAFGEVYVLDWGLALGLEEDPTGRIPSIRDVSGPSGSPGYMAPEMVSPEDSTLSSRTDVYLLGAMLHEVLMGAPPHSGATLRQVMFAAYRSEPHDYPERVPRQLAAICHRAMAADPLERYESAESVRQALADFSRQRQSLRLSAQATERLAVMLQLIEEEDDGPDDDPAVYDSFGQARFGFEQALEVDAANLEAREGLQQTLVVMAERELDRGAVRAASLMIADLPEPISSLNERLEALRSEEANRAEEFEKLQEIRQAFDIEIGRATRSISAIVLGLFWGSLTFFMPEIMASTGSELTHTSFLTHSVVLVGVLAVGLAIWRHRVFANAANSRMVFALVALLLGAMLMRWMLLLGDVPVRIGLAFEILLYGTGGSMIAMTLDRRLLWATLPYLVAAVAAILLPDLIFRVFGMTNLISMSLLAWVWWPGSDRGSLTPDG